MAETISSAESGAIPLTETMLTKKGVEELIATVRKGGITPKGSSTFASLPTPAAENLGWMYNVTDAFTTTADWVEGAGKNYPAGTNVYVCNPSGSTYKWDALPGEGLQLTTDTPQPNGTAAAGSALTAARADHVHATDTTRAAAADLTSHTGNTTVHITAAERAAWNAKQAAIAASGILKGDGAGGVSAAVAGTDYVAPSALSGYVPTSRKVNGKPLTADVTLSGSDISATATNPTGGSDLSKTLNAHLTDIYQSLYADQQSLANKADVSACAAAADAASAAQSTANGAVSRVAAIEAAAGTLLTNLSNAALADASMTSVNTIKTAVLALIDFLKAFAASSDNNAATTHTPAS